MICPYNLSHITQKLVNEIDADLQLTNSWTFIEKKHYMECERENCGAWDKRNGKCDYSG